MEFTSLDTSYNVIHQIFEVVEGETHKEETWKFKIKKKKRRMEK